MEFKPLNIPKKNKDGYIEDLSKLSRLELVDLRNRHLHLLSQKSLLAKLPDKGKNVKEFFEKIEKEYKLSNEIIEAGELFSKLNVAEVGKHVVNKMEWNGGLQEETANVPVLDSDDEEDLNPLKILANNRDNKEKIIKIVKADKSLITADDIAEIDSFKKVVSADRLPVAGAAGTSDDDSEKVKSVNSVLSEPHLQYVCSKEVVNKTADKFKPYQTTIHNTLDPEKEKNRAKHKHWEITAATPPPMNNCATKNIPLVESIQMQITHQDRMEEINKNTKIGRLEQQQRIKEKLSEEIKCPGTLFINSKINITLPTESNDEELSDDDSEDSLSSASENENDDSIL